MLFAVLCYYFCILIKVNPSFHVYSKLLDVLILPPTLTPPSQRPTGCCILGPAIHLYTYSPACLTSSWCLTNHKHERYTAKHCDSGCSLPLFPRPSMRTHSRIFTNTESWYWHWYHEYLVYAIRLTILLLHDVVIGIFGSDHPLVRRGPAFASPWPQKGQSG